MPPTRTQAALLPQPAALPTLRGSHPIFGVQLEYQRERLSFLLNSARQHGDIVRMRFGPVDTYLISHPDYIKHVLQDNNRNHPQFWDRPEKFDPERFAPERSAERLYFAYLPFGGGPRQCIGNRFALTEATLILATVAQQYRLRLVPGHSVEPSPVFVLKVRDGLPMTLHRV